MFICPHRLHLQSFTSSLTVMQSTAWSNPTFFFFLIIHLLSFHRKLCPLPLPIVKILRPRYISERSYSSNLHHHLRRSFPLCKSHSMAHPQRGLSLQFQSHRHTARRISVQVHPYRSGCSNYACSSYTFSSSPPNLFLVTAIGNSSISLAHTGTAPAVWNASGKPPMPSNRLS